MCRLWDAGQGRGRAACRAPRTHSSGDWVEPGECRRRRAIPARKSRGGWEVTLWTAGALDGPKCGLCSTGSRKPERIPTGSSGTTHHQRGDRAVSGSLGNEAAACQDAKNRARVTHAVQTGFCRGPLGQKPRRQSLRLGPRVGRRGGEGHFSGAGDSGCSLTEQKRAVPRFGSGRTSAKRAQRQKVKPPPRSPGCHSRWKRRSVRPPGGRAPGRAQRCITKYPPGAVLWAGHSGGQGKVPAAPAPPGAGDAQTPKRS